MARRILLLTGLATLTLPFFHSAVFGLNAMFFWVNEAGNDPSGTVAYTVLNTIRLLSGFAIPAFLFIGGYFVDFFVRGRSREQQIAGVRGRIMRILPPFLLWTVVHFVLQFGPPESISAALRPYYFIPLMIQFYILAPLLTSIVSGERSWKWLLAGTAALHFFLEAIQYIPALGGRPGPIIRAIYIGTPIWFFPDHILLFVLGMTAKARVAELRASRIYNKTLWLVLLLVCAVLAPVEYALVDRVIPDVWLGTGFNGIIRELYSLSVVMYFVTHESIRLPMQKFLSDLGSKSLPVYFLNSPVIYVVSSLIFAFQPWIFDVQSLYQLILISSGLFVPLLIIKLFDHSPLNRIRRLALG